MCAFKMGPSIYDVASIGDGKLSVMAKPVAGEWIDDEFEAIAEHGVTQIVSLLEVSEAYDLGLGFEATHAERHGLQFRNFPIPDRGLPESVRRFRNFCAEVYDEILKSAHVVVHCRAGIGRTGVVAASILLRDGRSVDDAFSLVSRSRGVDVPDTPEQFQWVATNSVEIAA
jgi:protein-tyrosine phosphatase